MSSDFFKINVPFDGLRFTIIKKPKLSIKQEFKYKRKISQLEYELQVANNKFMDHESLVTQIEQDMIQIQKAWGKAQDQQSKIDTRNTATSPTLFQNRHSSVQATVETKPRDIQTDPYTCCLDKKETSEIEIQTVEPYQEIISQDLKFQERANEPTKDTKQQEEEREETVEEIYSKEEKESTEKAEKEEDILEKNERNNDERQISILRGELNEALKLATERSSKLIKHELQIAECNSKIESLSRTIESKDLQLSQKDKLLDEWKLSPRLQLSGSDCGDKLALKSTVNSLQKLLGQKEETIARYQNLLKEDRDEHSKAAARLQEEIRNLHCRIQTMQNEAHRGQLKNETAKDQAEKLIDNSQEIESKSLVTINSAMQIEETARLQERVSTLEADLNITKELSDRWHRLAEERLKYMDRMRER